MLSLPTCPPWSSTAIQPCTAQECATTTRQACCKCFQQATSRYRARTPQKSSRRNLTKKQSRTHEITALIPLDRKKVVEGKRVLVRLIPGGLRNIKKTKKKQ